MADQSHGLTGPSWTLSGHDKPQTNSGYVKLTQCSQLDRPSLPDVNVMKTHTQEASIGKCFLKTVAGIIGGSRLEDPMKYDAAGRLRQCRRATL